MLSTKTQLWCAWSGAAAIVLALVGLALVSGVFMPPPPAHDSAAEVAAFYGEDTNLKRAGLLIGFVALALWGPFAASISTQMLRIEGRNPVLAFTQLVAAAVVWIFLALPLLIMVVAAFRPDRNPEVLQALNDLAWILLVMPISPFLAQDVAIAAAILKDRSAEPVFPRWVGYFNLWTAFLFLPAGLLGFFKTGAFAWHGLLAFWIPLTIFSLWMLVMAWATARAVRQEARQHAEQALVAA